MGDTIKRTQKDPDIKNKKQKRMLHKSDRSYIKRYLQTDGDIPEEYEPKEKY